MPCPCSSGSSYRACCLRWHEGSSAPDAEKLMRSRYCAYVFKLDAYLLATWHASTRPTQLELFDSAVSAAPIFIGLEVRQHTVTGPTTATVEFVAHYKMGGRAQRMRELSRFVFENGEWFYLDGDIGTC